jgi:flagellar hook assembly protein FlgD
MVSTIAEEIKEPGEYQIIWNGIDNKGRKLSSGIYFLKANYEQKSFTKKLIFID